MSWGYDLIKHDFTTYELLGQWGNEMGPSPTVDGWGFQDRGKTNAEIVAELYRDIRATVGENRIVIGCNSVGHLSAGIFDGSRTGDDVSGRNWERTRRMGVNTLGFRLPQNGIFFATDADCVPITPDIPWSFTEQWLRAVAESGSILLISPQPGAIGAEQKRAIRTAFSQCASNHQPSVPADWITSRTPEHWTTGSSHRNYAWLSADGASPFGV
jgi:alpha-galactosidase